MSGIYIHIPFCKQACHYCDFHFSTSQKNRTEMVLALQEELQMRKGEVDEPVETIYFGGGTPSVLSDAEIDSIIDAVYRNFKVVEDPEITLEANPDDLSHDRLQRLSASRINRLSIGIQSFYDEDLRMMNRAHSSAEARESLTEAARLFDNITIDLIYGIPGMTDERWRENVRTALSFGIPHISAYALTVEPRTALRKMVDTGKIASPDDESAARHFSILTEMLTDAGFVHYELSNFGKPGYFSRNNTAYWLGKKYLGIGPSAHSYDGKSRSWNVANNSIYLKKINADELPSETEILTTADRYNEYVMTGLRTIWGVSAKRVGLEFGPELESHLLKSAQKAIDGGLLSYENGVLTTTQKGKFLSDGLASDLFWVPLEG